MVGEIIGVSHILSFKLNKQFTVTVIPRHSKPLHIDFILEAKWIILIHIKIEIVQSIPNIGDSQLGVSE